MASILGREWELVNATRGRHFRKGRRTGQPPAVGRRSRRMTRRPARTPKTARVSGRGTPVVGAFRSPFREVFPMLTLKLPDGSARQVAARHPAARRRRVASASGSPRPPSPPRSMATSSISTASCPRTGEHAVPDPDRQGPRSPRRAAAQHAPTSWPGPSCGSSPARSSPSARPLENGFYYDIDSPTPITRGRLPAHRGGDEEDRRSRPSRSSGSSGRPPRRRALVQRPEAGATRSSTSTTT